MRAVTIALSIACALSARPVFADFVWAGLATSGAEPDPSWSAPANWSTATPSGSNAIISFPEFSLPYPSGITSNDIPTTTLSSVSQLNISSSSVPYLIDAPFGSSIPMAAGGAVLIAGNNTASPILSNLDLAGETTFNFTESASATLSGISGPGSLTIIAAIPSNTLTLGGPNTYANTTMTGGTLAFDSSNAIPGTLTLNSCILDCKGLSQAIPTLTIDADSSIVNSIVYFAQPPTVTLGGDGMDSTIAGIIGTFVKGDFALVKTGAGTLTITRTSNLYTGGTTLNAGTLSISSANCINAGNGSSGGTITLAGGTLKATSSVTTGPLIPLLIANSSAITTDASATVTIGGGITIYPSQTLTLNGAGVHNLSFVNAYSENPTTDLPSTITGSFGGTNGLSKTGNGTLILDGVNTYTGGTDISNGTLKLGVTGAIPSTTLLTLYNNATLDFNNKTQTLGNLSSSSSGTTMALGTGSLTVGDGSDHSFAGTITGSGAVTKTGSGQLTLSGPNSYLGGTTLQQGILSISANTGLGDSSTGVTGKGGTLLVTETMTANRTVTLDSGLTTFNIEGSTKTTTWHGRFTGGGNFAKAGDGTLILDGQNDYTGTTTISGGTLSIGTDTKLGDGTGGITGDGGTLLVTGTTTLDNPVTLNTGKTTTISTNPDTTSTLTGPITGGGNLVNTGNGTLTLTNTNNDYSGDTTLQGGTLSIGTDVTLGNGAGGITGGGGTLLVTGNTALDNPVTLTTGQTTTISTNTSTTATLTGTITGGGNVTKTGGGTLTLTDPNNDYNGVTTLQDGTLSIGTGVKLGDGTGGITGSGGTLLVTGDTALDNPVTLTNGQTTTISTNTSTTATLTGTITGGGNVTKTGGGTLTLTDPNNDYNGVTTLQDGTLSIGTGVKLGDGTGGITGSGGTLLVTGDTTLDNPITLTTGQTTTISTDPAKIATLDGKITGGGNLDKDKGGTLVLDNATNDYTGNTTVKEGTLKTAIDNVLPTTTLVTLSGSSSLNLNNTAQTIGNLGGASGTTVTLGSGNLTVGNSSSKVFAGTITGGDSSSLTKIGTGTLTLTGGSNTIDTVLVSAGELSVDGSLTSASGVTISSNGSLTGSGSIVGNVVNSGTRAPESSPSTLTIRGIFRAESGSIYQNRVTPTSSDHLIVHSHDVTIADNTTFVLIPNLRLGAYARNTTYTVITVDSGQMVNGTFTHFSSTSPLVTGFLSYTSETVILTLDRGNIADLSFSGNPGKVAAALDILVDPGYLASKQAVAAPVLLDSQQALDVLDPPPLTPTEEIFATLIPLDSQQIYDALDQMHPALYKGMDIAQENNAIQVQAALGQRLATLLNQTRNCLPEHKEKNTHIWASGLGDFLSQSTTTFYDSAQVGYDVYTGGVALGIDYRLFGPITCGAIGAYTYSSVGWKESRGHGEVESGYAGLYLSGIGSLIYANLSVTGARNFYEAKRNIVYPDVDQTAKNTHRGEQLTSHFDMGINFGSDKFTVRPFDSLDWILQTEDAFTETGSPLFNLSVDQTRASLLRNELGFHFSAYRCHRGAQTTFDAKVGWVREIRMRGKSTEAEFAGTDIPFTVIGYFPNRNLLAIGASISTVALQDRLTCTASYNGVLRHKYADHTVGAQLNFGF